MRLLDDVHIVVRKAKFQLVREVLIPTFLTFDCLSAGDVHFLEEFASNAEVEITIDDSVAGPRFLSISQLI